MILDKVKDRILKPCNLIIATLISCLATVMLTTSQYMAILLPGEVFRSSYEKANMAPYVLSRTLEDGGTIFFLPGTVVGSSHIQLRCVGCFHAAVSALCLPAAALPSLCHSLCRYGHRSFGPRGKSLRGKTTRNAA